MYAWVLHRSVFMSFMSHKDTLLHDSRNVNHYTILDILRTVTVLQQLLLHTSIYTTVSHAARILVFIRGLEASGPRPNQ